LWNYTNLVCCPVLSYRSGIPELSAWGAEQEGCCYHGAG